MFSLAVTIAVFVLVLQNAHAGQSECSLPPQFWCSSEETASKCQVTEQCRQYNRREAAADKVNFALYFESLCPDCKNFFRSQMGKAYDQVKDIMNITLVPYGNAREMKTLTGWKFDCQHGEEECVGNIIETCAINLLKNISVYFPFIFCMEEDKSSKPKQSAEKCAKHQGIDLQPILKCSTSAAGNAMEHEMAVKTEALNPPHKYVPWVTINGIHTEEIEKQAESDLVKLICDTYKGTSKPAACNKYRIMSHSYRQK